MQSAPYCDASRTPVQFSGGCGSRRVKSPTGAAAYGIPLKQTGKPKRKRYTHCNNLHHASYMFFTLSSSSTTTTNHPNPKRKHTKHTRAYRKYRPAPVATPCSCPFAVVTMGLASSTVGSPLNAIPGPKLNPANASSVETTRPLDITLHSLTISIYVYLDRYHSRNLYVWCPLPVCFCYEPAKDSPKTNKFAKSPSNQRQERARTPKSSPKKDQAMK